MDWRIAPNNFEELQERMEWITGKRVKWAIGLGAERRPGKGWVGQLVENLFGVETNNRAEPDLLLSDEKTSVEIKVISVKRTKHGFTTKERVKVSPVNYATIGSESWETSSCRKKLAHVLFVPYLQDETENHQFGQPILWLMQEWEERLIETDWLHIQHLVRENRAQEISGGITMVLEAMTSGGGKGTSDRTLDSGAQVKQRSFGLKTAFLLAILNSANRDWARLFATGGNEDWRAAAYRKIRPHIGQTLGEMAATFGIKIGGGKQGAAALIHHLFDVSGAKRAILEFDAIGLQVRTVRRDANGKLLEHVSLRREPLVQLAGELDFESSHLQSQLGPILFVPHIGARGCPIERRVLGRPLIWVPTSDQLAGIAEEWAQMQKMVREGKAQYHPADAKVRKNQLPGASSTKYIHLRPKGANREDTELDPCGVPVTKQCFWLNGAFVAALLAKAP